MLIGSPMFGEQDYEHSLHELVAASGSVSGCASAASSEDVWPELARLDVLVHASTIPEPFGTVVLEGMAAGLTVLAPDQGGPATVIEDGRTGRLFRMGDQQRLAAAMRELGEDPGARERLSGAARRRSLPTTRTSSPAVWKRSTSGPWRTPAAGAHEALVQAPAGGCRWARVDVRHARRPAVLALVLVVAGTASAQAAHRRRTEAVPPTPGAGEVLPPQGCSITLGPSSPSLHAGEPVTLTGALSCPGSPATAPQTVTIEQHVAGSPGVTLAGSTTTDEAGDFSFTTASGLERVSSFWAEALGARSARTRVVVSAAAVTLTGPLPRAPSCRSPRAVRAWTGRPPSSASTGTSPRRCPGRA